MTEYLLFCDVCRDYRTHIRSDAVPLRAPYPTNANLFQCQQCLAIRRYGWSEGEDEGHLNTWRAERLANIKLARRVQFERAWFRLPDDPPYARYRFETYLQKNEAKWQALQELIQPLIENNLEIPSASIVARRAKRYEVKIAFGLDSHIKSAFESLR